MTVRSATVIAIGLLAAGCQDPLSFTDRELEILSRYTDLGEASDPGHDIAGNDLAIALGRTLYFDCDLSGDLAANSSLGLQGETGKLSCNTCHDLSAGGADPRLEHLGSQGVGGVTGVNTPTLFNAAWRQTWDWSSTQDTLWGQITVPLTGGPHDLTEGEIAAYMLDNHRDEYAEIFGDFPDIGPRPTDGTVTQVFENTARILDAFVRTLRSDHSRFDEHMAGGEPMAPAEIRGAKLFIGKAACNECHSGPTFSDEWHHNVGLSQVGGVTKLGVEDGRFHTPTLRNVGLTPPYMHNGALADLWDVVDFYRFGGHNSGFPGTKDALIAPLNLSDAEVDDLVAFLRALNETEPDRTDPWLLPDEPAEERTCP